MEERVIQRLIAVVKIHGDDPGWATKVTIAGIQMTYTWQGHQDRNFYTVENITSWGDIKHAKINPLLDAAIDLIEQVTKEKP